MTRRRIIVDIVGPDIESIMRDELEQRIAGEVEDILECCEMKDANVRVVEVEYKPQLQGEGLDLEY